MLRLKEEILERGEDVIIFVSKQRGRKLRFPIDTDPKDYPKFAKLGFRIFRCDECGLDSCVTGCPLETSNKDSNETINEMIRDEVEETMIKLEEDVSFIEEDNDTLNQIEDMVVDYVEDQYESFTLKDLRELFPTIKAVSRKEFIRQINEQED